MVGDDAEDPLRLFDGDCPFLGEQGLLLPPPPAANSRMRCSRPIIPVNGEPRSCSRPRSDSSGQLPRSCLRFLALIFPLPGVPQAEVGAPLLNGTGT